MEEKFKELEDRLREVADLNSASALLGWDQSTYMPPGGGPARARQMATLSRLAHEKFTDEAVGRLLKDLQTYGESQPYDSYAASFIRVARRRSQDLMGDQSWAKTDDFSGGMDSLFADLMGGQSVDEMKADMAAQGVDVDASVANMGEDAAEAEERQRQQAEADAARLKAEEDAKAAEAAAAAKAQEEQAQRLRQRPEPGLHGVSAQLHHQDYEKCQ